MKTEYIYIYLLQIVKSSPLWRIEADSVRCTYESLCAASAEELIGKHKIAGHTSHDWPCCAS